MTNNIFTPTNPKQAAAYAKAKELLQEFREGKIGLLSKKEPEDFDDMWQAFANPNADHMSATWRRELMFLLYRSEGLTLKQICSIVGITHAALQPQRRADPLLDQACNDYMKAYFEDAAMGDSSMKPAVLTFALEAKAGWQRRVEIALKQEDVENLVNEMVRIVARVVDDDEILMAICDELEALELGGQQLTKRIEARTIDALDREDKHPLRGSNGQAATAG